MSSDVRWPARLDYVDLDAPDEGQALQVREVGVQVEWYDTIHVRYNNMSVSNGQAKIPDKAAAPLAPSRRAR